MFRFAAALVLAFYVFAPVSVRAEHAGAAAFDPQAENGLAWTALTPQERRVLHPHAEHWIEYPPEFRRHLLESARRYLRMSPTERRAIKERARHFRMLSPREKRRLCMRYYRDRGHVPPLCRAFVRPLP